ncbi:biogenesis of lysosome-related organelles complex 1 subunit 4 [Latimeria chalumnae]|uniref:biogenesis of lysosome-related organelles complex 1 subunit 4 n=1 Tax=Latimeria chalumnae TaxID=7897 RepID=UPI00313B6CB9
MEQRAAAETDSGNVSQSQSSASGISEQSGSAFSPSPSFNTTATASSSTAATEEEEEEEEEQQQQQRRRRQGPAGQTEAVRAAAESFSSYLTADVALEITHLEKSLEEMLTRVDEFVGMLDMIRNDSSQIVNDSIPQIHAKASEMKQIYKKIDKLEAFVKMVGGSVADMEERMAAAEADLGTFPNAFKKIFRSISVSPFLSKALSPRQQPPPHYEPPPLFRTEDYFEPHKEQPQT